MAEELEGHEPILKALREIVPEALLDTIPPDIFDELGVEFSLYKAKQILTATFPAHARFANPMGTYQGGMQAAALDIIYGCLAMFITGGKPSVTLTMECSYHRPIPADDRNFLVEARLRAAHGTTVFLEGAVKTHDGKLATTSATSMAIVRQ